MKIAVAGCGAIARSRHLPVLRAHPRFELVALVDPAPVDEPEPRYESLAAIRAAGPQLDAIAIATPPQVRSEIAREAISAGLSVLLEKPPAASVTDAEALLCSARSSGVSLFAAWHSRYAAMVQRAQAWLQGYNLVGGRMTWREDVRAWHPGQDWIWRKGGMGVFDPGMNGLSLLTLLHPKPLQVVSARFRTFRDADTPVSADLRLLGASFEMAVTLDFEAGDGETWRLELQRDDGQHAVLDAGGARWQAAGGEVVAAPDREYEAVYHRFAELVDLGASDVDLRPLELVEKAFSMAHVERLATPHP